jgi:hypothetical protein
MSAATCKASKALGIRASPASNACQHLVTHVSSYLQGQQSARNTRAAVGQVVLPLLLVPRQRQRPVALPPTCAACVSICTGVLKEYARGSRPGSAAAAASAAAEAEACRPAPHLIFFFYWRLCVRQYLYLCTVVLAKQTRFEHLLLPCPTPRVRPYLYSCTSKASKVSTYC